MRIFKTPTFTRDQTGQGVADGDLKAAVAEIAAGLIDAHLGAELVKKRIARAGGGKSGGYRTILAFRQAEKVFFLHLFAKNEKATVSKKELAVLKGLAKGYMALTAAQLDEAVVKQALLEVM